jgi:hypothetical protein
MNHQREVYNLLDLIGDLGGVLEVIIAFFGLFIYPISEFSFFLTALERLFLARTVDKTLFKKLNAES